MFGNTVLASVLYNTTIASPNYPSNYGNDLECRLLIKVDNTLLFRPYIVKVIFNDFHLEGSCVNDVLKFYDGMNAVASPLGSYCGTTHPDVIYSTGLYLYVKFHTDSSATYRGFSFSFSAVEEGTFTVYYSPQLFNFLKPCECLYQSLRQTSKHLKPRCSYYSGVEQRKLVVKSLKLWQAH